MQSKKTIIGIDPGYGRCGVGIIRKDGSTFVPVFSECIETHKNDAFADRLYFLAQEIEKVILKEKPDTLAMESLFVNKNQKTITGVYQIRGMVIYLAMKHGLLISEMSPQQVKIAVTGYGKSDKRAVEQMTRTIFELKKDRKYLDDEIDALAVAYSGFFY